MLTFARNFNHLIVRLEICLNMMELNSLSLLVALRVVIQLLRIV